MREGTGHRYVRIASHRPIVLPKVIAIRDERDFGDVKRRNPGPRSRDIHERLNGFDLVKNES
jgi:hypothetical protein